MVLNHQNEKLSVVYLKVLSVLGPLLFVIYINDLPDAVTSQIYLFADDTKIFNKVDSLQDALQIQNDINSLETWSNTWLLKFHPDKCHVLSLGKGKNINQKYKYTLGEVELQHVPREKDLGVIFDTSLTFEEHIQTQVKKANSIIGLIKRSFSTLSPISFRKLYTSFVRPHLEYAQAIWSPRLQKNVNLVEGAQRRASKIVEGCKNLSYPERLQLIDLLSLKDRRMMSDMTEVYKHLHYYDATIMPDRFSGKERPCRKHDFELQRNFGNDGFRGIQTNSYYFRTVKTWNELPKDVVNSPTISIFKKRLSSLCKEQSVQMK